MIEISVWTDENNLVRGSQAGPADRAVNDLGWTSHLLTVEAHPEPNTMQLVDGELVTADQALLDSIFLPGEQDGMVNRLWSEIDYFVQKKPNGRPRYDHNFKSAANALDVPAMTPEKQAKYQAVFAWVESIWTDVYYPTKAAIDAAATLAELEAISWDLSPYEVGSGLATADPDISLTELRA